MLSFQSSLICRLGLVASFFMGAMTAAHADNTTAIVPYSPRALQEALAIDDHLNLYAPKDQGLGFTGGFFSGRASGIEPVQTNLTGETSNDFAGQLEGDQRVYALLVDGHYDFNYDQTSTIGLHPYLMGGMGLARYDQSATGLNSPLTQNGDMIPLFRVGGGVTYRLGQQWNLSLDYKAGFSSSSDQVFTGRNQQSVDLQTLNMGMHYNF